MTFDPSEKYEQNRIVLGINGEYADHEVQAYCSPDADGQVYFSDGTQVGDVGFLNRNGAPFDFDAVLVNDVHPQEGEVSELAEALGPAFEEEFEGKVDTVFDTVFESDDPLDEILNLDEDEL